MAATQPPSTPMCPDWIFSNTSNVHLAKDRAWFTDYTPFESFVGDIYGMFQNPIRIAGIGTVELQTKRSPNLSGRESHGVLRLTNVLHPPSALCNIVGQPIVDDYPEMTITFGGNLCRGLLKDKDGRRVAYFDIDCPLFRIKLRGPPVGPSIFQPGDDSAFMINVFWSDSERQKWKEHQDRATTVPEPEYTDEEKQWLKDNWVDEFHFLLAYGLKIYKDEDREEGRSIARALMRDDNEEAAED